MGRGQGCHGAWQGLALSSSHSEEFALRAVESHGRVFREGNGVSRLSSSVEWRAQKWVCSWWLGGHSSGQGRGD